LSYKENRELRNEGQITQNEFFEIYEIFVGLMGVFWDEIDFLRFMRFIGQLYEIFSSDLRLAKKG